MSGKQKKVGIEFTQDYVVDDERKGTAEEESYEKGQRKFFTQSSADHFVNRDAAVYLKKVDQN